MILEKFFFVLLLERLCRDFFEPRTTNRSRSRKFEFSLACVDQKCLCLRSLTFKMVCVFARLALFLLRLVRLYS